jgi:hypothetical protein
LNGLIGSLPNAGSQKIKLGLGTRKVVTNDNQTFPWYKSCLCRIALSSNFAPELSKKDDQYGKNWTYSGGENPRGQPGGADTRPMQMDLKELQ